MAKNWWRNQVIRCTTPPASLLNNLKLNFTMNTGHIYKFTALCKKVGSPHFGKFEYKQDKIDPKLGFAPPGAQ